MSNFTVLSVYSLFLNFYCNEYLKKITCSRLLKIYRSSRPEVFCEKGVLRNIAKFTGKHLYQSFYLNKVATLWKRDSGTGVLCEFCEISKNTFFYRTPLVAAFESNGFYQRRETSKNSEIRLIRTSFWAIHKHKQFSQNAPSKMLDWAIHPWISMMDRNSW